MIKLSRPGCPDPQKLKDGNYRLAVNKDALKKASFGKCMYCEAYVLSTHFGDVEHIKPKAIYPELEFEWNNLGFCCAICNNNKRDRFAKDLPYINPYEEDPNDFILASGPIILPRKGNERADITILHLELNRLPLISKRQELIQRIQGVINNCFRACPALRESLLGELRKEGLSGKEFSFVVKSRLLLEGLT
jgi:uncharacterized protein (TIGR02646 family)